MCKVLWPSMHLASLEGGTANSEGLLPKRGACPPWGHRQGPLAPLSRCGQCPLELCGAKPACLGVQGRLISHNIYFFK